MFCYVLLLCLRQRDPHTLVKGFAVAIRTAWLNPTWNLFPLKINLAVVTHLTASVYTTIKNGHDHSVSCSDLSKTTKSGLMKPQMDKKE